MLYVYCLHTTLYACAVEGVDAKCIVCQGAYTYVHMDIVS
jgi:hypothetical protein